MAESELYSLTVIMINDLAKTGSILIEFNKEEVDVLFYLFIFFYLTYFSCVFEIKLKFQRESMQESGQEKG